MSSPQSSTKATSAAADKTKEQPQKPNKVLEEDDEFEDFPAEGAPSHHPPPLPPPSPSPLTPTDWSDTETDGKSGKNKNLWEESWDDDETTDDFAAQLR